jgi:hypothetical protein
MNFIAGKSQNVRYIRWGLIITSFINTNSSMKITSFIGRYPPKSFQYFRDVLFKIILAALTVFFSKDLKFPLLQSVPQTLGVWS